MSLQEPEDQDIVIVGGTGDLARRKLLPALYNLHLEGVLPGQGKIIGYARTKRSDDEFRAVATAAVKEFSRTGLDEKAWPGFAERLTFVWAEPDGFAGVRRSCEQPTRLVYLATPPSSFPATVRAMGEQDLVAGTRPVVEQPVGQALACAQALYPAVHAVLVI